MCEFFDKRGYPASVVEAGHHRAQQIDQQSALQTSQKENSNRIPFTLRWHRGNTFFRRDTVFYGSAVHLNKTTKCRQF